MTIKAAYFKGERLWQNLQGWGIRPDSTLGKLTGVYRLMGKVRPLSRNYFQELTVKTAIRPVTAVTGLDRQSTLNAALHQKHDALLDLSVTLGPVSWCDDEDQKGDVSAGLSASTSPQTVSHGALGGSWTTEAGKYVLVRNPTTGAGFVSIISARASGTVDLVLEQDITTAWDIINIQQHYPEMAYLDFSDSGTDVPSGDFHRTGPSVDWRFVGGEGSRLVLAAAYVQDLS